MNALAATLLPLFLLASALGQTSQPGAASAQDSQAIKIIRRGSRPSRQGPNDNFTGSVRVDPLWQAYAPARASGSLVTFEPGARTAWHTHPLGQILIVTAGCGWTQCWGEPREEIHPGDVVWCTPGKKHWHGASSTTSMGCLSVSR